MASISCNGSKGHHKFTLTVTDKLESNSASTNASTVSYSLVISSLGGGWNWEQWGAYISYVITINGIKYTGSIASYDGYSDVTIKSGTFSVAHNTDGNKSISYSFSVTDTSGVSYTCGNASASGTMALTTIPRYLSVLSAYVSSKTETSAVVSWNVSDPRDSTYYSFDKGATWIGSATDGETLASDLKSGTFTIANLEAGKTYTVKLKFKRKDSQLWTEYDMEYFQTCYYPHLTISNDFTIGEALTLELYNPLSRAVTVKGYAKSDGSEIFSGTTSGYKLTGFNDAKSVNAMYASIPNAQSGAYRVVVSYGDISMAKDTSNVYKIKGTEIPTINAFDYIDGNASTLAVTGNDQQIVQNKSIVRARFHSATANYGASGISYYTLECNGSSQMTLGAGSFDVGTINSARNVDLKLTAYDSRGLSASKTITVQMLAYEAPKANVELKRLNNYEDETYLTVDVSKSSLNGKNTATIKYRYKASGGSYNAYDAIPEGEEYVFSLDKNNAYIFEIAVTDAIGSTFTQEYVLDKGVFPLFIDTVKNSVGINCFPVHNKSLEVNGLNLLDYYKCEKSILLTTGVGLKITINSFGAVSDKITLIVSGADNASVTPVFKVIRIKNDGGWGQLNLGLNSEVTVSGNNIHVFATQWSYFTVKAPLGCEITLSNSAL